MTNVMVACCSRNLGHWGMFTGLIQNLADCSAHGIICTLYPVVGDSLIERARQEAAAAFLNESKCDYLFMLDDDIQMPPDALRKLVEARKDIVAGVYRLKNDSGKCALRGLSSFKIEEHPDQLVEVQYVSTGCMLMSRKVIQDMWDHYTDLYYTMNNVDNNPKRCGFFLPFIHGWELLSEDWAFCQRAKDIGHQIYVHTGVICDHWGLKCYPGKGER